MYDYLITPKAPLLFRDGKPFGTDDNTADTLLFPQPSTIAGAIRTAWAESEGKNFSNPEDIKSIKHKSVYAPFLTDINKREILVPVPADSLCLTQDGKSTIYRLIPKALRANEGTDINTKLMPVFPREDNKDEVKGKPAKDTPKFWSYGKMEQWLLSDTSDKLPAKEQGILNLSVETRTHVSIQAKTQTAKSGHLFQTAGLDFSRQRKETGENQKQWGWTENEYGLACQFQEDFNNSYRTIGGESRLGSIQKVEGLIPECPAELSRKINQGKGFRLILATPAIFKKGFLPDFIDEKTMQGTHHGMTVKLHAVAVQRWQAGTSWDMAATGNKHNSRQGKGMRSLKRLAPAGTVYWFELIKPQNLAVESFWLTSISDERADDGYGITIPGVWTIPTDLKDNQ